MCSRGMLLCVDSRSRSKLGVTEGAQPVLGLEVLVYQDFMR